MNSRQTHNKRRKAPKPKAKAPSACSDDHLIEMGCEMWQLCKNAQGWVEKLGARHQRRASNQIDWARSRLTEILAQRGIELQDRTGEVWDEGDPVNIVNAPETAQSGASKVTSTLEPIVLRQGRVVRRGKVTVSIDAEEPSNE